MRSSGGLGNRLQLGARMSLVLAATVLLSVGPLGALVIRGISQGLREEARDRAGAVLLSLSAPTALTLADYALDRLDSYLAEAARPTQQDVALLSLAVMDGQGIIVAESSDSLLVPEVPGASPKVVRDFMDRANLSRHPIWQSMPRHDRHAILLASMPAVSGQRWGTLVGVFDLALVEERIDQTRNAVVAVLLLLAVLVGATSYSAFRRLVVAPLEDLATAATKLRSGARHVRLLWQRRDELGMVADSFDHMAGEIERYTESLEQKVAERSAEVEAKNRALEAVNVRLHEANAELERLAHVDPLTLVANRRFFNDAFGSGSSQDAGPWAILMCDIDHFKRINDTYGHPVGDVVLREVARILRDGVRGGDLLARYGGEEFVAILRSTKPDAALEVAERLRRDVAACDFARVTGEDIAQLTISIGIAFGGQGDSAVDREAALERADRALYAAKYQGRDRVVFWDPGLQTPGRPNTGRVPRPDSEAFRVETKTSSS